MGAVDVKARELYYDILDDRQPPVPGDFLQGVRARYEVTEVRPVDSRVWWNRWLLTVVRVPSQSEPSFGRRVHPFRRYRRGEGPEDFVREGAA